MDQDRDEDICGQSIIENPHSKVPVPKEEDRRGVQKMMLRGTVVERLDYLENGVELEDMSIDLIGKSPPTFILIMILIFHPCLHPVPPLSLDHLYLQAPQTGMAGIY